jgi:hypothetical protein
MAGVGVRNDAGLCMTITVFCFSGIYAAEGRCEVMKAAIIWDGLRERLVLLFFSLV